MIIELMTSHTMKKKFTVWKKIITKFVSKDVFYQDLHSSTNKADWKYDSDDDIGLDVLCLKEEQDQKGIQMKTLLGSVLLQESTESEVCYMVHMRWIWGVTQAEIQNGGNQMTVRLSS